MDLIIGSHVSFNKKTQMVGSVVEALSYNANTFMFYTGAPQNTTRCDLDDELIKEAKELMEENNININNVIVHAPYIINLANIKNEKFNIEFLKNEINRVEKLGITNLVLHPGSHVGVGVDAAINNIASSLNQVLNEKTKVNICLETMAGKGTEIGRSFEEIKQIMDKVKLKDKLRVCLDTCHINDAGYDLSNFDSVILEFDKIIGLEKLAVVHINDSKNIINSNKDRHENIGYGKIGFANILNVIYNEKIKDVPKILETPYVGYDEKYPPYKFEIEMIRNKKFNDNLIDDCINYYKKD